MRLAHESCDGKMTAQARTRWPPLPRGACGGIYALPADRHPRTGALGAVLMSWIGASSVLSETPLRSVRRMRPG
jgi:hypothetical protein